MVLVVGVSLLLLIGISTFTLNFLSKIPSWMSFFLYWFAEFRLKILDFEVKLFCDEK